MSDKLFDLIRAYLDIVDNGTETDQGEKRTIAHEAMMDEMEKRRIPFNSRFEARWIARSLMAQKEVNLPQTRLMFARRNKHNGLVMDLHFIPQDDNKEGLMPVMVVILPFTNQPFVTDRSV